jgi:hypothetical protein
VSAWSAGDGPVLLASSLAALLVLCSLVVLAQGIAVTWRARRRNGRQSPGPPPARLPVLPVGRAPWVPPDGEPLRPAEEQAFAGITGHLKDDGKKRMAARGRRPLRRTRERARR